MRQAESGTIGPYSIFRPTAAVCRSQFSEAPMSTACIRRKTTFTALAMMGPIRLAAMILIIISFA